MLLSFSQEPIEPKVRLNPDENFGDDPDTLRWRAWWQRLYDGEVIGIELCCYPVIRLTPCGAWINPHAYRQGGKNGLEWSEPFEKATRWVSNDGGQAWAKRTQQEAIDSLIFRYSRWADRIRGDVDYFVQCGHMLARLYPDRAGVAKQGMSPLKAYVAESIQ